MSDSTTIPALSFQNDLGYDISVYDSFTPTPATDADKNYFGQLTLLGNIAAKSTGTVQPIHTSSAFVIDNTTDKKPLKRCTKMAFQTTIISFTVGQADEDAMTATFKFADFFLHQPDDPVSQAFKAILTEDPKKWLTDMNAFFLKQPAYSLCTFQTYMMTVAYTAMHPESIAMPPQDAQYSLSKLVALMGGNWPDGMPDISVSNFTCNTQNDVVDIWVQIDISSLPFESDQIAKNVNSMYFDKKVQANLQFNYGLSIGIFGTRLTLLLETIKIPISGFTEFGIEKPTITIDINPLFKFVVFTVRGIIPFSLFNKQFDANISMVIDNVEAEIGVVIEGDNSSLPAPPLTRGVHFDEFRVGLGIFFEPPGYAFGVQGKFHIGDPSGENVVDLNDDTFALVCKINGEVPEPVYASFYIPKMDINQVVAIFTDSSPNLNVPVTFTDLSFRWAEDPMEPYTLPDALKTATDKQLVNPGGPVLVINTFQSPILHVNAKVSLFEIANYGINANINGDGIFFTLDFGGILTEQMTCRLSDFHNFYGGFKFGIDHGFSLPTIAGVSLGAIHVQAIADAHIIIQTSLSDVVLKIGGSFEFEGRTRQFGDFSADIHIEKMTDAIGAIITNLTDYAEQIFDDIIHDAEKWAGEAKAGLISGYNTVSDVLKTGYNKSAAEVASVMKGAGYAADQVASEIKSTFNLGVDAVESAMKTAGYAANEVIDALKNVFNINDIASALKNVYGLSVNDINSFLQSAGYTADQVKNAFESLGGDFANFAKDTWDKVSNPDTWNPSKW